MNRDAIYTHAAFIWFISNTMRNTFMQNQAARDMLKRTVRGAGRAA